MTDDDIEFDEADRARLRRLEQRMHALGFVRHPEHGFWVAPGMSIAAGVQGGIPNAETVAAIEELEAGGGRVLDGPADDIIETILREEE